MASLTFPLDLRILQKSARRCREEKMLMLVWYRYVFQEASDHCTTASQDISRTGYASFDSGADSLIQVGSSAKEDPSKISHHIYRIGYHFRTEIFDTACSKLGYAQRNGKLVKVADFLQSERMLSRFGSNFEMIDLTNRSDADKVKKYIRELFPRIPGTATMHDEP